MNNTLKIILQPKVGEKKNKKIEDISKKLQKIEKLKIDFEILKNKIKTIQQKVDEKTCDSINSLSLVKEKFIIALIAKYELKSFTKWEKEIIASIINEEFEILTDFDYNSETLNEAIHKFIKLQKDNFNKFEMEMAKEAYKSMLDEFYFDFDEEDSDFDFEKMNDPIFKKRFEEKLKAKIKENHDREMQLEKEKKNKNTDIDFQKIYKKLAKLAHPDLQQSEFEKVTKVEVMQRLTNAWDERNYYELLMLWLEIDPDNSIELEITESNQKNIIAQLNDTIKNIENEMYQMKFNFEDTAFYYQFNATSEKAINTKIEKYKKTLDQSFKETIMKTQDIGKTKAFKTILKDIYESNQKENFIDFLNQFGSDLYED